MTLEAARRKSEDARDSVANGIDPSEIRIEKKKARQLVQSNNERVTDGLPIINLLCRYNEAMARINRAFNKTTHTKKENIKT